MGSGKRMLKKMAKRQPSRRRRRPRPKRRRDLKRRRKEANWRIFLPTRKSLVICWKETPSAGREKAKAEEDSTCWEWEPSAIKIKPASSSWNGSRVGTNGCEEKIGGKRANREEWTIKRRLRRKSD